jgi:RNA polymerase sigma-54 factor
LTIRDVAQELKLHAATIARAIANKNVSCGHYGILPLSFFFRRPEADISQAIIAVIAKENEPLSDEQIAAKLRASGVPCARRTVSKYRARGKIPPSSLRK